MTQPKKIISPTGEPMLSAKAAAKILSCAQDYVSKLCREGKLRGTQIEGAWFVEEISIVDFSNARMAAKALRSKELAKERRQENALYRKTNGISATPAASTAPLIEKAFAFLSTFAARNTALTVGGVLLFGAIAFAGSATYSEQARTQTAAIAQVDSPFFGAHPMSVTVPNATQSLAGNWFANIFGFIFGGRNGNVAAQPVTPPTNTNTPSQVAQQNPTTTTSTPSQPSSNTKNPVVQNNYQVIERTTTVEQVVSGVTEELLTAKISEMANALRSELYTALNGISTPTTPSYAAGGTTNNIALSQIIDRLDGVTITNATITSSTFNGASSIGGGSGTVGGSGTTGQLAYWSDSSTLAATSSPTLDFVTATTASTTQLFGALLTQCDGGNVLTWNNGYFGCAADQTAAGQANPFAWQTNYGVVAAATTSPLWARSGLFASSTSHFANADFVNATTSSLYVGSLTGLLYGTAGQVGTISTSTLGLLASSSISATAPLAYNVATGVFSITQSSASTDGYLSSSDFASFNTRLSTTTLGLFDKGYFFSTTSADAWAATKGYTTFSYLFPDNATSTQLTFNGGLLSVGSTTINGNATSTGTLYASIASSSQLYGAGLTSCNGGNVLTWSGGLFGCVADQTSTGQANAFTFSTNYGGISAATTSPIWAQNGIQASSTSRFVDFSFASATGSSLVLTASTTVAGVFNAVGGANLGTLSASGLATLSNGFLSGASSTINGNATTTGTFFATTASSTNLYGAGLASCSGSNALTWSGGLFGCVALASGGSFPFTPSTFGTSASNATSTLIGFNAGIYALGSSTVGNGTAAGGLTISGNATTTGLLHVRGTGTSTILSDILISGNIVPSSNNTYYLGAADKEWHSLFLGPGSLYVNGQQVISTNGGNDVVVSTDPGENLVLQTSGSSNIELNPTGGQILLKNTINVTAGKSITTSDLSALSIPSGVAAGNITVSGNAITASNLNGGISLTPTGTGGTYVTAGNFGVGTTNPNTKLEVVGTASSTSAVISNTLTVGTLSGLLFGTNGVVSAVSTSSIGLLASSSISATAPLAYNQATGVFSITQSNTSTDGYLSSTDWNTFNNKVSSSSLSSFVAGAFPYTAGTNFGVAVNSTSTPINFTQGIFASSTSRFTGISTISATTTTLAIGSLTGVLQAVNGLVSASTTLSQVYGGTGLTTYAAGDILYADSNGVLTRLPVSSNGLVLKLSGGLPAWSTDLTSGGGGGATAWATTTDDLAVYVADTTNVVIVGAAATSTLNSIFEVVGRSYFSNNLGIGTTSAAALLSVQGNGLFSGNLGVANLTATGTVAAQTLTTTNLTVGSLTGLLYGTNGSVGTIATNTLGLLASSSISATGPLSYNQATGVFSITQSNTSTDGYLSSTDWNSFNARLSTTTLGLFDKGYFFSTTSADVWGASKGYATFSYLFPNNATSTGLGIYASSTIGNGTQIGGLTVSGGATTTGNAYFAGNVGIGTNNPIAALETDISGAGISLLIRNATQGYGLYVSNYNTLNFDYGLAANHSPANASTINYVGYNNTNTYSRSLNIANGKTQSIAYFDGTTSNVGIGTTSPYAKLSVVGQAVAAYFTATTSTTSTFPYASSTAITVSGTASSSNLIVSNNLTVGSLTGLLYGTNGSVGTIATNTLGLLASSSISATGPLSYNQATGVFSITQSNTSTDGYLSSTDWNTFNNKISSTSLSAGAGISYNSSNGVITNTIGYLFPSNATTTAIAFNGGATFAGATSSASFAVTGSTTISGVLNVGGALNANGALTVGGNTSLQGATSTTFAITGVTSSLLKTTSGGSIIAAVAGTDYALPSQIGSAFPFTPGTNFGVGVNSTSTTISFTNGIFASSTSQFTGINTISATTSLLSVTGSSTITGQLNAVGGATFGVATIGTLSAGASTLSSTLAVSGLSTLAGFISSASSTINGNATTTGTLYAAIASSTNLFGAGLNTCNSGSVLTWTNGVFGCAADQTATGAADPFTFATNFGTLTAATSSIIWAQNGLFASSSSYFANATTSTFAITNIAPSSLLKTTTGGAVIAAVAGTDYENALTFSSPLIRNTNTISIQQGNGSQNGYISSTDWNTFNNKIGSSSLSGASVITYNSSTGVFSTQAGTFGGSASSVYTFPGDLIVTGTASTTNLYIDGKITGANLTSCSGAADKLIWNSSTQQFGCATDAGSGGSNEINWTYFNGSGARVSTSSNQVLIGFTSTSTLSKLEVVGGATFDYSTTTGYFSAGGTAYFGGNIGVGTTSPSQKLSVAGGTILQVASGNPTLATSTFLGTGSQSYAVALAGRYAYVAASGAGLKILDVSDPSRPAVVGTYSGISGARSVAVSGKYAYVGDASSGLVIVDVSRANAPTLVGSVAAGNAFGLAVSGRYVVVPDFDSGNINIVDASNPAVPVIVSTVAGTVTGPTSVAISGRYVYVGNVGDATITVIDIINPLKPTIVSTYSTNLSSPAGIAVSGRYAYVGDSVNGLYILDISNPASLSQAGSLAGSFYGVQVAGDYVYAANFGGGTITVIDVHAPAAPASIGTLSIGGSPRGIAVSGKYAYVGVTGTTLKVVDINGAKLPAAHIGSLESSIANITDLLNVGGDAYIGGGLNVGNLGIFSRGGLGVFGTTSLQNFTATSGTTTNATSTSFFATTASSTNLSALNARLTNATTTSLYIGGLTGLLYGTNGSVGTIATNTLGLLASSSISATAPLAYNQATGVFSITQSNASTDGYLSSTDWNSFNARLSTTTVGLLGYSTSGYPFAGTGNSTSTLTQFNGGLTAFASSTIGNGTQIGGLTVSGGATTTGNAYFAGNIGVGRQPQPTGTGKLYTSGDASFNYSGSNAGNTNIDASGTGSSARVYGYSGSSAIGFLFDAGGVSYINGGNVGIGTTSPTAKLNVQHSGEALTLAGSAGNSGAVYQLIKSVYDGATGGIAQFGVNSSGGNFITDGLAYSTVIGTANNTALQLAVNNVARVTVDTSGNVGIGTSSPSAALEVKGFGRFSNSSATAGYSGIELAKDGVLQWQLLNNTSGNSFGVWEDGSTQRLTILEGGNVGIGSTTPWGKLSVTNTGSGPSFVVEDDTSPDSTPFIIDASGNVGIGTASPTEKITVGGNSYVSGTGYFGSNVGIGITPATLLHISNGSTPTLRINRSGVTNADLDISVDGSGNANIWNYHATGILGFATNNTERVRITGTGNVGIGTTSPYAKLSVGGDVVATRFISTSTAANILPFASTTAITATNASTTNLTVSSIASGSLLKATTAGSIIAAVAGTDYLTSANLFAFPFTPTSIGNSTSTLIQLNAGLIALASSTIGNGTQAGGLTIAGGATTTGTAYFASNVGVGTTSPGYKLGVQSSGSNGDGILVTAVDNARIRLQDATGAHWGQLNSTAYYTSLSTAGSNSIAFSPGGVEAVRITPGGNFGIGTTSAYAKLSVEGSSALGNSATAGYFVATTSRASTFPYASTTVITSSLASTTNLIVGNLSGLLYGTNGSVGTIATNTLGLLASSSISATGPLSYNQATGVFSIAQSGTATDGYLSSTDWNAFNARLSTTTVGLLGYSTSGYPFAGTGNSTSTLTQFNGGLTAFASSTIGNGTQTGGLTVSGGATTTGDLVVRGTGTSTFAGGLAIETSGFVYDGSSNNVAIGTSDLDSRFTVKATGDGDAAIQIKRYDNDNAYQVGLGQRQVIGNGGMLDIFAASGSLTGNLTSSHLVATFGPTAAGIGTSTPWGRLSITNTGTGPSFVVEDSTSPDSTPFLIDASGNVGIGTSSPATTLSVSGSGYLTGGLGVGVLNTSAGAISLTGALNFPSISLTNVSNGALTTSAGGALLARYVQGTTGSAGTNDYIDLGTADGSGLKFYSANTQAMVINSAGNVGIGTTSPYAKLSVGGDVVATRFISTSTAANIFPFASTTAITATNASTTNLVISGVAGSLLKTLTDGTVAAAVAGTDYATVAQISATFPFTPVSYGNSTSTTIGFLNGLLSVGSTTINGNATTTGAFAVGGQSYFAGNVGIGTTSPQAKLSVQNNSTEQFRLAYDNTNFAKFGVGSTGNLTIQSTTTGAATAAQFNVLFNQTNIGQLPVNIGGAYGSYPGVGYNTNFNMSGAYGYTYRGSDTAFLMELGGSTGNTINFKVAASGTQGNAISFNTPLTIGVGGATSTAFAISTIASGNLLKTTTGGAIIAAVAGTDYVTPGTDSVGNWFTASTFGTSYANATSTLVKFNAGIAALASSTIGDGSQAGGLTIHGGATTTGNAYFAGNIGVGTSNPSSALEVSGSSKSIQINAASNDRSAWLSNDGNGAGILYLFNGSNSNSIFITGSGDSFFNSGNVGIGTTSPWAKLSVEGSSTLGNSATAGYFVATTTTASIFPFASSTALTASGTIFSGTASTTNLTISSIASGNLLKTTTAGSIIAAVAGTDYVTPGSDSVGAWFTPTSIGNSTSTLIQFNAGLISLASTTIGNGSQAGGLTINGGATTTGNAYFAGNVGIGTTSPIAALNIASGKKAIINSNTTLTGSASYGLEVGGFSRLGSWDLTSTDLINVNGGTVNIGGFYSGDIAFKVANTERVRIQDTTGNFGIGTTSPASKLSVQGNGYLSGNLFVGGAITSTSSVASTFPFASTTAITANNASTTNLTISSIASGSLLKATTAGSIIAAVAGTDYVTPGSDSIGNWFTASTFGTSYANATSTLVKFNAGIAALASSTIGDGSQAGGLTIAGGATTTGNLLVQGATINLGDNLRGFSSSANNKISVNLAGGAGYFDFYNNGFRLGTNAGTYLTDGGIGGDLLIGTTGGSKNGTLYAASAILSASSTIGGGTQTSGLTISGGATTTGNAYFAGNVGIGTTSPGYKLGVNGTFHATGQISSNNGINIGDFNSYSWGDVSTRIRGSSATAFIALDTGSTERFRIDSTGNVGIGTTSPYAKLSVGGDVVATRFVSTSTAANIFPFASTTAITTTNASTTNLTVSSIASGSLLKATTAGSIIAAVAGTDYATPAQISATFPFTPTSIGNSTSTLIQFNAGLISLASSTIGNGTATGGLTISGNSTTTGNAYFAGNVGIGRQPPSSSTGKLYTSADASFNYSGTNTGNTNIDALGTGSSARVYGYSGASALGFLFDAGGVSYINGGNVGIGTTGPGQRLTVINPGNDGAVNIAAFYANNLTQAVGIGYNEIRQIGTNVGLNLSANGTGQVSVGYASTGGVVLAQGGGNVGIGTTSPYAKLSVEGASALGNSATAGYFVATTSAASIFPFASSTAITASGTIYSGTASTTNLTVSSIASGSLLKATTAGSIIAAVAGTDYLTAANVAAFPFTPGAFGSTVVNATSTALQLTGGLYASSTVVFGNAGVASQFQYNGSTGFLGLGSSTPWAQFSINPTGTNGAAPAFAIGSSTATNFVVTNSGNVGIGVGGPQDKLHIQGSNTNTSTAFGGALGIRLKNTSSTAGNYTSITNYNAGQDAVNSGVYFKNIDQSYAGAIDFTTRSTVSEYGIRMRIDSTGNVGIGTTSPYASLSVAGWNGVVANIFTATSTTATSTFAGGFDVGSGAFTYDFSSGVTSIDNLQLGALSFDTDAGQVSWADLPVSSSAATGTVNSYTAQLGGTPVLTVYGEAAGYQGGVTATTTRVGIGTTTPWRTLSVTGSSDLGTNALAGYFTATSSVASTFPFASTTVLTASLASTSNFIASASSTFFGPLTSLNSNLFSSTTLFGNSLLSNATSTTFAITGVTSSLLKTTSGGSIIAAVAGTDYVTPGSDSVGAWFTPGTVYGQAGNSTSTLIGFTQGIVASSTSYFTGINTISATTTTLSVATTASTTNLTVSSIASGSLLKATTAGSIIAAVAGTDYATPAQIASSFPFTPTTYGNATSTLLQLNAGLIALASSTIGDGTQIGGLTISGGATTTGNLKVTGTGNSSIGGKLGIGTINPSVALEFGAVTDEIRFGNSGYSRILSSSGGLELYVTGTTPVLRSSTAGTIVGVGTTQFSAPTYPFQAIRKTGSSGSTVDIVAHITNSLSSGNPSNGYGVGLAFSGRISSADRTLMTQQAYWADVTGNGTANYDLTLSRAGATTTVLSVTGLQGNVGIGTTSPYAKLSIEASRTDTNATLFAISSTTNGTATSTVFSVSKTGSTTLYQIPSSLLKTDANGTIVAAVAGTDYAVPGSDSVGEWFTPTSIGNSTSTLLQLNAGLIALASSTIGDGSQTGGLTIAGGATTTGNAYFGGSVGVGTTSPFGYVSINPNGIGTIPAFVIGSSTRNLLSINTTGDIDSGGRMISLTVGNSASGGLRIVSPTSGGRVQFGRNTGGATYFLDASLNGSVPQFPLGVGIGGGSSTEGGTSVNNDTYLLRTASSKLTLSKSSSATSAAGWATLIAGDIGLGTSTPYALLSVVATSTSGLGAPTTLFAIASTTGGTATSTLFSINNIGSTTLASTFGQCSGSQVLTTNSSGTIVCGTVTAAGDGVGSWFTPTSIGNSTSTLLQLNAGLISLASSTVGSGTQIGGLTISGGATTTGNAYVAGNVAIGRIVAGSMLDVDGTVQLRGSSSGTGLYVNSSGNVGIGTTGQNARLEIRQDGNGVQNQLTLRNNQGSSNGATSRLGFGVYRDVDATALGAAIDAINMAGTSNGDNAQGATLVFSTTQDGVTGLVERMRILNTGNVGIGTTSPAYKFSVEGSSTLGNQAVAGYFTATSSTATSTFAGGVGIGTSTAAAQLDVYATGSTISNFTGSAASSLASLNVYNTQTNGTAGLEFYTGSTLYGQFNAGGTGVKFGALNGADFRIRMSSNSNLNDNQTKFFIENSTGNVGIGTTSPYLRLSVEGASALGNSATAGYFVATSSTASTFAGGLLAYASSTIGAGGATTGLTISGGATTTGNSYIVGNVGVGKQPTTRRLDVSGTSAFDDYIYNSATGQNQLILNSSNNYGTIQNDGADVWSLGTRGTVASTLGTPVLSWTNGGLVGISTTSPWAKFTIAMASTTPTLVAGVAGSSTPAFYIGTANQNGNIGLGTTNPRQRLEIDSGSIALDPAYSLYFNGATDSNWRIGKGLSGVTAANTTSGLEFLSGGAGNDGFVFGPNGGNSVLELGPANAYFRGAVGIGDSSPTEADLVVGGDVYINTFGSSDDTSRFVCIDSSGGSVLQSGSAASGDCDSSSQTVKHDINTLTVNGIDALKALRPVSYIYNEDPENTLMWGFIAEELDAINPSLAGHNAEGAPRSIQKNAVLSLLAKALQEVNLNLETIASTTASSTVQSQGFATSFFSSIFARMQSWLADTGNGIANLFAHTITATVVNADTVNTKTLCLDGLCITKDQLQNLLNGGNSSGSNGAPQDNGGGGSTSVNPSAPIITINGNNPAQLVVGDVYTDLGITITDDTDQNLGYLVSLNGGENMPPDQLILDTSTTTTHSIIYSVTDNNGNVTTATRIVVVYQPTTQTPEPTPEPPPEPTPEPAPEPTPTPEPESEQTPEPEPTPAPEPQSDSGETVTP